jgi:hypothetical protein
VRMGVLGASIGFDSCTFGCRVVMNDEEDGKYQMIDVAMVGG